jgi:MFS family permease
MSGVRMVVHFLALYLGHGAGVARPATTFGVSQMAASLLARRLPDRHGLKRPVYGGGAIAAFVGALVAAVWPALPDLCIAALLEGAAIAVVVEALQRHAGQCHRR